MRVYRDATTSVFVYPVLRCWPRTGEFDFDPDALLVYAREILRGLVKIGFRRIYIVRPIIVNGVSCSCRGGMKGCS